MALLLVDGVGVKDPSEFTWGRNDVSDAKSGRGMNALMYKNRIAQKRKLHLSWWNPTPAEAAHILQAFNPVYVQLTYPDAQTGTLETKEFYQSDPTAPLRSWSTDYKRYSKITFDMIER